MKKQIISFSAILLLSFSGLQAQEAEKATTFSGSADVFYKYDFNQQTTNDYTSFTKPHNSFELNMVSLAVKHKMGKASAFADVGFGNRAKGFSYNDVSNGNFLIKQLYLSYDVNEKLKLTMGSWATHFGYELVNATDNKNYSMSYAFSYGPFFHTGVKAEYTTGKFNFMFGVANPTDFKSAIDAKVPNNKYVLAQVGYANDKTKAYFNFQSGSNNPAANNITQLDLTVSQKLSEKLNAGFNGTVAFVSQDDVSGTKNWYSIVGYLSYEAKQNLGFHLRSEYYDDKDGVSAFAAMGGANVWANTLSANYKIDNLTIVPEIRFESASDEVFTTSGGNGTKSNGYVLLGAVYKL